jgi:hypothetical protein
MKLFVSQSPELAPAGKPPSLLTSLSMQGLLTCDQTIEFGADVGHATGDHHAAHIGRAAIVVEDTNNSQGTDHGPSWARHALTRGLEALDRKPQANFVGSCGTWECGRH